MKTTRRAATAIALGGALLMGQTSAFAKGPVTLEAPSRIVPVKEHGEGMANFPWGLEEGRTEDLTFTMTQEIPDPEGTGEGEPVALSYTFEIPWIEVEKDGEDKVTMTMDKQIITMAVPGGPEMKSLEFKAEVDYEDLTATFERGDGGMTFDAEASAFAMKMLPSEGLKEMGGDLKYDFAGKGIRISGEGSEDQDWSDFRTLDLSYEYAIDSLTGDFRVTDPEGTNVAATMSMGATTGDAMIREGLMSSNQEMNDFAVELSSPMPMEFAADKFEIGMKMPMEPSPEPQDIAYKLGLEGLSLDEMVWNMADPGGVFPKEINRVMIDLQMQAMLMVSLLDPEAMAEAEMSGMPPLIPTGMKINEIAFDGLGLKIDATGEGELKGTQPQGNAYITVRGLPEFVADAREAGMFGEQEAMMIEGMAGQLGEKGDDGELIFDVETEGQMININGNPVMPIPGME